MTTRQITDDRTLDLLAKSGVRRLPITEPELNRQLHDRRLTGPEREETQEQTQGTRTIGGVKWRMSSTRNLTRPA